MTTAPGFPQLGCDCDAQWELQFCCEDCEPYGTLWSITHTIECKFVTHMLRSVNARMN